MNNELNDMDKEVKDMDNEEKKKPKKWLIAVGGVLVAAAGILVVTAFVDFFTAFGGGHMPQHFWMFFVGFPLLGAGITLINVGRGKKANGGTNSSVVVHTVVMQTPPPQDAPAQKKCAFCGRLNAPDDTSCDGCGANLE
jgi:hypothetical protein